MKWINKNLQLKNLILWDENVRFYEGLSGKHNNEIVNFLFSNNYKMLELTKLFVVHDEIPQDEKILVIKIGSKYKVLDGNRRISVLLVLNNPDIIKNKKICSSIKELKKLFHAPDYVETLIAPSESDAKPIIDRRHYGEGFLAHGAIEKDRTLCKDRQLSNKDEFALEYFEKLLLTVKDEHIKTLKKGYSTIKRMFNQVTLSDIKKYLFVSFEDNQLHFVRGKHVQGKLYKMIIINDILNGHLNTRVLNKTKDTESYLCHIGKRQIPESDIKKLKNNKETKKEKPVREVSNNIKFFKRNHCKIYNLYNQINKQSNLKTGRPNEMIIICLGHLLELSIKVFLKDENMYVKEACRNMKEKLKDPKYKNKFTNTKPNLNKLERKSFHNDWNFLRHATNKTATSFDSDTKTLIFEIVEEIDNYLYENTA